MAASHRNEVEPNTLLMGEIQERIATAHALIAGQAGRARIEGFYFESCYWILNDVPEQLFEIMGVDQFARPETAGLNGLLSYLRRIGLADADGEANEDERRLIEDVLARANDFVCAWTRPAPVTTAEA
jgi:hypothetical protein